MPNYKLQVEVVPQYLPEQSDPAGDLYTFAYSITITNKGNIAAQVISRYWSVNDANGLHEKVKGQLNRQAIAIPTLTGQFGHSALNK